MIHRSIKLTKSNSFFLFGARGTGKSSLLHEVFSQSEAVWVDLLDPELCDRLSAYPNRLLELLEGQKKKWVIIDEIQKVPQLLEIVHQKIFKKEFLFALTGSSARKIKRGASNLLAGRAFVFTLFPFTSVELGDSFQLQRALEYGTLPEVWNFDNDLDRKRYLKSYATTFVKEEIIAEQIVRKLAPFRRFLEASAICNGEIANFSNIAKDINSDPKTVSNYYEILEDTLLAFSLPSFGKSIRKRQKKAKKYYYFDNGVARALAGQVDSSLTPKTMEYGKFFESFIITEVQRLLSYEEKQFHLSFLNVGDQQEIDLIIERASQPPLLCEIKATSSVDDRHVVNLETLGKDIKGAKRLLISNDKVSKQIGKTVALHWSEALRAIVQGG